jgi:hypothetical protein
LGCSLLAVALFEFDVYFHETLSSSITVDRSRNREEEEGKWWWQWQCFVERVVPLSRFAPPSRLACAWAAYLAYPDRLRSSQTCMDLLDGVEMLFASFVRL